ncbi:MAG TPA: hypothetical protein VEK33_12205 [Terriglobales bacterium]|nr:hypothetical protein [Terriglobales bacterium]
MSPEVKTERAGVKLLSLRKIHRTLRVSPAMAAGVKDRLWSVEDLVALWESYEQRRAGRAA